MFENRNKREKNQSETHDQISCVNENSLSLLFFFLFKFFFHRFCMTTFVFNVFLKSFAQEIGTKPNKINTFSMLNFCSSEVNRRSTQTQSPPYDPLWRTRFLSSSFDHNKINYTLLYSKTV